MWKTPFRPVPSTTFFPQALCIFFYFFHSLNFFSLWTSGFPQVVFPHFTGLVEFFWGVKGPGIQRRIFSGAAKALTRYSYFGTLPPSEGGKECATPLLPSAPHPSARMGVHLPQGEGFSQRNGGFAAYRLELIFAVISRRLFWILLSPFFRGHFHLPDGVQNGRMVPVEFLADVRQAQVRHFRMR